MDITNPKNNAGFIAQLVFHAPTKVFLTSIQHIFVFSRRVASRSDWASSSCRWAMTFIWYLFVDILCVGSCYMVAVKRNDHLDMPMLPHTWHFAPLSVPLRATIKLEIFASWQTVLSHSNSWTAVCHLLKTWWSKRTLQWRSTAAIRDSQSDRQVGSLHKLASSIVSTPIPVFKFRRNKSSESWHQESGCHCATLPGSVGLQYVLCRLNENWNGRSTHAVPASQSDRQVGSLHKLASSIVRLQFPSLSFILQAATNHPNLGTKSLGVIVQHSQAVLDCCMFSAV